MAKIETFGKRALARALCTSLAASAFACAAPASRPAAERADPSPSSPGTAPPASAPLSTQPATSPPDPAAPSAPAPSASPARPPLRRMFAAHPKTVARQVPADNDARIEAHLAAHPDTPADIATAIRAHELWVGMTEAEVVLSVGEATRREPATDRPGAYGLFYAGEGWLLGFDENGYLYSVVER